MNNSVQLCPGFGLKECFWGFNSYVAEFIPRKQIAYTQQYSEFVSGIETDSNDFRQLKKLMVRKVNEESSEYLLRNSLNFRELLLFDALCLDDTLLQKILKMKSLSKIDTLV
ncbi:hypothetical protein CEXT_14961 [Caerostris extrusa]|uniref:Uncharacterized protein n=1 Tax=Caerostris extrusa TaxID=172846 RepID=A0AAV4R2D2_CAEEX|nr:hypothetical protein CEXT_14961 [Caerostris extrusa]